MKEKFVNILQHDVKWQAEMYEDLPKKEIKFIKDAIKEGNSQGLLRDAFGWWEIVNWKNIARDLYNAVTPEEQIAANQSFKDNTYNL
jgi:hypothetical protein